MRPHAFEQSSATTVTLRGNQLLAFAGTNYLGLAHHPAVLSAAAGALRDHGLSPTAARHTSGGCVWHDRLEEALAEFLQVESALLLSSGWLANLALGQALRGRAGAMLLDADAHASLVAAAASSGAPNHDYGPGDLNRANALLDRYRGTEPCLLTDGVYPQVGRMAPLAELLRMLPKDGLLVIDDSHGLGVTGPGGRGTAAAFDLEDTRILQVSSLAKSLGSMGGFVSGAADRVEAVRRRAEAASSSTPLAPSAAAGAFAALEILQSEPVRLELLHKNTRALHRIAERLDRPHPGSFLPVITIRIEDESQGRSLAAAILSHGLFVPWMRYPGTDGGYLRVAVNAEHTEAEITRLGAVLAELLP
ncbi:MAG: 8-amino-7-oxononanoate synthase [Planctomycetota bacterium]